MLMELRFILWMYLYILLGHEHVAAKVNTILPGEIPNVKIDYMQPTTSKITRSQLSFKDNTEASEDITMPSQNNVTLKIKEVTLQSVDYVTTPSDKELVTNKMLTKHSQTTKNIKSDSVNFALSDQEHGINVILNDTKEEKDNADKKLLTDTITTVSSVNVSESENKLTEGPQDGHDQVTTIATSKLTDYLTSQRSNSSTGNPGRPTSLPTLLPGDTNSSTAQPHNVYNNTKPTTAITEGTSAEIQTTTARITTGSTETTITTTEKFKGVNIFNGTTEQKLFMIESGKTNDSATHNLTNQDRTTQNGVTIPSNGSWEFISTGSISSKVQTTTADSVTINPATLSVNGSRTVLSTNLTSTAESTPLMSTHSHTTTPTVVNYTETVTVSDNNTFINNNTTTYKELPKSTKYMKYANLSSTSSSQATSAQSTKMSSDIQTTQTVDVETSTKSSTVVTQTLFSTILPSQTVTQHQNLTLRPTDDGITSKTTHDTSSTSDITVQVTMQFTNEYNESTVSVTSVIPNNTLSSGGLSKTAKIGIGVGSMVLFWIILGPLVCLICRLKDKNSSADADEEDEKPRDSFSQTLMEQYIMTELARGREKKYQTTLTNECEIRKLDDSSEYEQSVDAEVTSF